MKFQEQDQETPIGRRNRLYRRRDLALRELKKLHEGDEKRLVRQVARDFAQRVIRDYWQRDAWAQPDLVRVRAAIVIRDQLRGALADEYAARDAEAAVHGAARAALAALSGEGDQATMRRDLITEWQPRLQAAAKRYADAEQQTHDLRSALDEASVPLGSTILAADDWVDRLLTDAEKGSRTEPIEPWDPSVSIWKALCRHVGAAGVNDERVTLEDRSKAIVLTLFARAVLSPDPADDLLGRELRELTDVKLLDRVPPPSELRGQSVHKIAAAFDPPSTTKDSWFGPLSQEESKRRNIHDQDARIERFLLVAERAYEAVVGTTMIDHDGSFEQHEPEVVATDEATRPAQRRKKKRPGRPPVYDTAKDADLCDEMERLGMGPKKYAEKNGLDYNDMVRLRARVRTRRRAATAKKRAR